MLVLQREVNQDIVIGDELLVIRIVDIRGNKVRLGFLGPKGVSVHRREVFEAIKRNGEQKAR